MKPLVVQRCPAQLRAYYKRKAKYGWFDTLRSKHYSILRQAVSGINLDVYHPLIGCTVGQYREWIESHFTPEMNWSNFGKRGLWEIDHTVEMHGGS